MKTIDLHGLTEVEAILEIDAILWALAEDEYSVVEIITGKGLVLQDLVIEAVEEKGFAWHFNSKNHGSLIVQGDY